MHSKIEVAATRVAWSVHGSVRTLGNNAFTDCIVSANHGNLIEKGLCDSDGSFRVMGLVPGFKYTLTVESEWIQRVIPAS